LSQLESLDSWCWLVLIGAVGVLDFGLVLHWMVLDWLWIGFVVFGLALDCMDWFYIGFGLDWDKSELIWCLEVVLEYMKRLFMPVMGVLRVEDGRVMDGCGWIWDGISGMAGIDGMDWWNGWIGRVDGLDGLDGMAWMEWIGGLDGMDRMDWTY
jgi:hypothetical protein